MGYPLADLGGPRVLKATRHGQTGCHWCQVDCRHYHWVPADYASGGRDIFLDDFEPTYATFAMLGLTPAEDTPSTSSGRRFQARLDLRAEVDRRLILPIEQLGCDVIDVGLGLAALFEGVERGIIPHSDVPAFLLEARSGDFSRPATEVVTANGHRLEAAVQAVAMLRSGQAAEYPALRAVGDGPQALAQAYPPMQDVVFTSGKGTLGNAGHCNALWTFLMPFSRFFGHYVGQYYKVDEELPSPGSDQAAYRACFERVVGRLLRREFFWLLANALSMCAFTFVIFSQDGEGERLDDDDLLVRLLRNLRHPHHPRRPGVVRSGVLGSIHRPQVPVRLASSLGRRLPPPRLRGAVLGAGPPAGRTAGADGSTHRRMEAAGRGRDGSLRI